jgi:cobalt-zinc-cadmium resistance protein CzcA
LGITLVLVLIGAYSLSHLPIDAVPDITNIQVVVNTKTGALDPEKIELLVTRPVEIEMSGLPGLEEVRSISKYGLSQVTLVFHEGMDLYWARQQVNERLQSVRSTLPLEVTPELAPVTTGLGEVYMYAVEATDDSPLLRLSEQQRLTELRTIQDYVVRPWLKRITGVADVDSNGGYQKEIHVNFFPQQLENLGLAVQQLSERLATVGENYGGGYIQRNGNQIIVRTVPGLSRLSDLEKIPLGLNVRGRPILLKEVAIIREDHALRLGAATRNGHETVLGTVLMRTGANSRQVAEDSSHAIQTIQLPPGVKIVPLYSRSVLVNATIHTVTRNLIEGAALVVSVLLLLLGNIRAAILVALAIPISMLVAARGMVSLGISGNLMSLGAIDFGLLVDGSVVLIENVMSRLNQVRGKITEDVKTQIILESSSEVVRPVVFGLFMIMVVYVPVLTLEGIEGKMFRPMALTVLMALGASLFVAVFVMPVLADLFLEGRHAKKGASDHSMDHETPVFRFFKKLYLPGLRWAISHLKVMLVGSASLLVIAGWLVTHMGADFIPRLDEGDFVLGLSRDAKIGIDSSILAQEKAEEIIRSYPEVTTVFSRIGTPESATDPMGVNLSDTFILLNKDRSKWKFPSKDALIDDMRKRLIQLNPDQEINVTQPIEMRFNEILEGSRADVTLRILGFDLIQLTRLIDQAKGILEKIHGVDSVSFDALTALRKSPMLDITPNYDALAKYGVLLGDVNRFVELSMSGKELGSFFEQGRRFPIRIHLDESLRDRVSAIESLPVALPLGGTIPLKQLAHFSEEEKVTTIARYWGERYAAISINLHNRDVSSFVKEAQEKIQEGMKLPEGFQFYWGGQFKNLSRAQARLFLIVPITILGVFIILLRNLKSLKQSLLVFSSVPFAAVGGVFFLAIRGIPLSVSAGVGFIALIGIALLNALVLITVLNHTREKTYDLEKSVIEGAVSRLRPVLMTAFVASLGFIPMALNTGLGAEVQRPLATVVVGGLLTSTFLTLFLLPSMYRKLEQGK